MIVVDASAMLEALFSHVSRKSTSRHFIRPSCADRVGVKPPGRKAVAAAPSCGQ
jgi:hypothetical protein